MSEPLQVPAAPGHVPLFSAKDPAKRVARAVLSIGRLFSAEAQAQYHSYPCSSHHDH